MCICIVSQRLGQPALAKELLERITIEGDMALDDVFKAFHSDGRWSHLFYIDTRDLWNVLEEKLKQKGYLMTQFWHNLVHLILQINQVHQELEQSTKNFRNAKAGDFFLALPMSEFFL